MPLDTIFVVHHAHTDIGFTNDPPIFWEMQYRFMSEWQMGATIRPEATYLLLPFNVLDAQARFDVGGVPVRPHLDQLAGSCRDYFTVQGWVDFNNGEPGVTIAAPENPMVQLGDFHFAHDPQDATPERALLLGWVTNNYWETNFPGAQPGVVTARYVVQPYAGEFDEARARRLAAEAAHARPLIQHPGEPAATRQLPAATRAHAEPARRAGWRRAVDALNASNVPQTAGVASGLVRIRAAQRCEMFGEPFDALPVRVRTSFPSKSHPGGYHDQDRIHWSRQFGLHPRARARRADVPVAGRRRARADGH